MSREEETTDYVEFSHPGGHLVAKVLVPSIGQNEAPVIRERMAAAIASVARGRAFVIDVSQVSLVSSLGLGTFVDLRNTAEKAGLRPVIFGMNRHLAEVFQLMRVERLFTILRSPQELEQLIGS